MRMTRLIALIPARAGSKGIKNKNIISLAGKPLIVHTILAAQQAECFDRIYVSSDSSEILQVAAASGATEFKRNPLNATDAATTNSVIAECIEKLQLNNEDILVLLQPTSPLRNAGHIKQALAVYLDAKVSEPYSTKSVVELDAKCLYAYAGDEVLHPLWESAYNISRRQDLPRLYIPNGAIYIFSVNHFKMEQGIPNKTLIPYPMAEQESLDIDTPEDLQKAEAIMTRLDS